MRLLQFSNPIALHLGLAELRRQGLTPRGLLFLGIEASGEIHLAVPDQMDDVTRIRVGEKLSLSPPWEDRCLHFDSIHRLPGDTVLWNGDRRLPHPGSADQTALSVAMWVKAHGAKNVFLGCTPHQAGAWLGGWEREPAVALHASGLVDVVPAATGLLARRAGEPVLQYLPYTRLATSRATTAWQTVYESPMGRILMLERRILGNRLILTCEKGLVDVDVARLPKVRERARAVAPLGMAVVGRIDGGAFAVSRGRVESWGLVDIEPATLVGTKGTTLLDLAKSLA